ncbi:hypothetical protein [Massilia sp. TSP1-1-2]|uniref:hypothetical protein n=1 Tax=unclassified Massilia TaxID=2609279 RepID=UPI003CE68977
MMLISKTWGLAGLLLAALITQAGCSKPGQGQARAPVASAAPATKHASRLGELGHFRVIAADVAKMVERGDLAAAKARIKDLEIAWDEAESGLKPRAAADWHTLDKAIDQTLDALRAEPPNASACRQKSADLLKVFALMD